MAYLLLGLSDDGREDRLRAILSGDTGLAATGPIVDDDGRLRNVDRHGRVILSERVTRLEEITTAAAAAAAAS